MSALFDLTYWTALQAYYLRTTHTDPARLRKMVVVTNSWHMPRARAIFDYVFQLPLTSSSTSPSSYSKARQEGRASDLVDQGGSTAHEDVLIIRQTQVTLSPLIIHYS